MENESAPSLTGIDDLVSDSMGGVPSATSDVEAAPTQAAETQTETAPEVQAQAEPVQAQSAVAQEGQTPTVENQPTPEVKYRIGDREYTAQEILAWQTSAQQLPHLQKKYMEALEQRQAPQASQPSQAPQQPQIQPQQMLAQLKAKYEPEMQELVKKGLMSQDFVTLFPAEAAQMLWYRDSHNQIAQAVQAIGSQIQQQTQQTQASGLINEVGRNISNLAQSGEAFAPLKDPQQVQGFMYYLWNLNPQVMHLKNPEFLAGQWVAYNRNQYLQMAQQAQANQVKQQQLRYATADASTGSRPMGAQPVQKDPLQEMVEDFQLGRL